MIKSLFALCRPHQWVKNFFVFLPLFFGGRLLDAACWLPALIAFLAFSLVSSSVYCLNDVIDAEADRRHPQKCHRPIACGAVSPRTGYAVATIALLASLALSWLVRWEVTATLVLYWVLNVAYCLRLKQFVIVDVFIIALGFVLRIFAGGMAVGVALSQWVVLMTFLLSLFLAFAKRRDDVVIYENTHIEVRDNVSLYKKDFLDVALSIVASMTMICYIMYTISEEVMARIGTPYLYVTSIFVLAGIIRYLQLTLVETKSGSPTKILLTDRFIQLCIMGWIIVFFIILYI